MKNLIIYLVSLIPNVILFKLENLFSISQGKGFSSPKKESRLILDYVAKKNLDLKTVFDIGCFHGDYTNEILKKFPNSSYFLFEPDENNFQITKKRFCNNKNINVFQYAISNINKMEFFILTEKDLFRGH